MKILEFAFITHPATGLARSRAFYGGILGLTSTTSINISGGFWVEYEIGPHTPNWKGTISEAFGRPPYKQIAFRS